MWARQLLAAAQPYVSREVYANHLTFDEPAERVKAAYGDAKFRRLAELKARWDPSNIFRQYHNIPPVA
jgi:FAD/FMN-containing dehydrogenase